jgi:hypothetical protein
MRRLPTPALVPDRHGEAAPLIRLAARTTIGVKRGTGPPRGGPMRSERSVPFPPLRASAHGVATTRVRRGAGVDRTVPDQAGPPGRAARAVRSACVDVARRGAVRTRLPDRHPRLSRLRPRWEMGPFAHLQPRTVLEQAMGEPDGGARAAVFGSGGAALPTLGARLDRGDGTLFGERLCGDAHRGPPATGAPVHRQHHAPRARAAPAARLERRRDPCSAAKWSVGHDDLVAVLTVLRGGCGSLGPRPHHGRLYGQHADDAAMGAARGTVRAGRLNAPPAVAEVIRPGPTGHPDLRRFGRRRAFASPS